MDKLVTETAFAFYGLALLGVFAHGVKLWAMREISYSIYDYFFTVDPRGTFLTICAALGAVISAVGSGQISSLHTFADVSTALLAGFACDSSIYPVNSKKG